MPSADHLRFSYNVKVSLAQRGKHYHNNGGSYVEPRKQEVVQAVAGERKANLQ